MSAQNTKARRGRPIDQQMRDKIIVAAGDLFTQKGLHQTTMLDIAKSMQISKLTLYRRFSSKEELVQAVIQNKCHSMFPDKVFELVEPINLNATLTDLGELLMALVTSETVGMERAVVAGDNVELARIYYEAGPERVIKKVTDIFYGLQHQGLLKTDEPELAAQYFCALFKGSPMAMKKSLGLAFNESDTKKYCSDTVEHFIRSYCGD